MRIRFFALAALALLLGACTQDEAGFLPEGAEGTPIVFTATGLNPAATATAGTRAPVDGNWTGVQSVAVLMDGTVKTYNVTPSTADPTSATLTSTDPYYWTNHNDITVTAWWPYTAGETTPPAVVVKADQSARKNFEGSDLIVAEEQTVSYGNPTLRFTHRTARVTVVLTDYTEGLASVRLTGLSTENGNPAVIAPHDKGGDTYTALVAPQTVAAGTAFITCAFNNGKVFVYKMKNDAEWKAGEEYTYTVSLAAAKDPGYTVSEDGKTYTVYNANGLLAWNEAVQKDMTLNCTLTADITLPAVADGESNWTPMGTDYDPYNPYTGTFDGDGHTITGLTINLPNQWCVGLIGCLGGKVQNLTLAGAKINGSYYVGGVVGVNFGSMIGCTVSGTVKGNSFNVGGVVGFNSGTVTGCYATGDVSGHSDVGGVAGRNYNGTVTGCYHAAGEVSGNMNVGGVTGYSSVSMTGCYWSNNLERGIGNGSTEGATKVDGTTVTWQNAVDAMNTALQSAGSEWRYELTGELPTLKK